MKNILNKMPETVSMYGNDAEALEELYCQNLQKSKYERVAFFAQLFKAGPWEWRVLNWTLDKWEKLGNVVNDFTLKNFMYLMEKCNDITANREEEIRNFEQYGTWGYKGDWNRPQFGGYDPGAFKMMIPLLIYLLESNAYTTTEEKWALKVLGSVLEHKKHMVDPLDEIQTKEIREYYQAYRELKDNHCKKVRESKSSSSVYKIKYAKENIQNPKLEFRINGIISQNDYIYIILNHPYHRAFILPLARI